MYDVSSKALLTPPHHWLMGRSSSSTDEMVRASVVRGFAHGAMGRRIDPSWGSPIELFLVPASAPRLVVTKAVVCAILSVGWCV